VWFYALVQRLSNGKVVALRHKDENEAIRGVRPDMLDAWMFYENSEEQHPVSFLYVVQRSGMMIRGLGIHEVPDEVVRMLSPSILIEMAA
jgi:hypothetical protein